MIDEPDRASLFFDTQQVGSKETILNLSVCLDNHLNNCTKIIICLRLSEHCELILKRFSPACQSVGLTLKSDTKCKIYFFLL